MNAVAKDSMHINNTFKFYNERNFKFKNRSIDIPAHFHEGKACSFRKLLTQKQINKFNNQMIQKLQILNNEFISKRFLSWIKSCNK